MPTNLGGYYDRTESEIEKGYERHLFRAGSILQSAELNEIQGHAAHRLKSLGDAIYKDGDIIRDARVVVDPATGNVVAEGGAIYLDGMVRGVPPLDFTIATVGTVVIGVYLDRVVITEIDDSSLAEPAVEVQAYGEPGAARLQVNPRWGIQGDDLDENFFPVYYVDDGQLRAKEAPPVMDSVTQAIARYDVDSTGSNYVVEGMTVRRLADEGSVQVYDVAEGRARVNGFSVVLSNSRRVPFATAPVIKLITNEPKASSGTARQFVQLARPPAREISQVTITLQRTVSVVHSSVAGSADPLPDTSVVQIISVEQGGTTYTPTADYLLTGQTVDWSPSGAEPAPGSSYDVTYQYISIVTPEDPTSRGFYVTGAVAGTLILTTYNTMLPRIDRLCIDEDGRFEWVEGISTDYNPVRPSVPVNLIPLAQVMQNWDETSMVAGDGVRTVPMRDIENLGRQLDTIRDLIAQQLLISDLGTRDAGAKKGLFVDPFLNDDLRDAGIAQDAACVSGILMLPIEDTPSVPSNDIVTPQTCTYDIEIIASQPERTGSMKVNPYMAFDVPMSPVTLEPAVDRWTEVDTQWTSDATERFVAYHSNWHAWVPKGGHPFWTNSSTSVNTVSSTQKAIEYLRTIEVKFTITGFGPGETLSSVTFDGIAVTPTTV